MKKTVRELWKNVKFSLLLRETVKSDSKFLCDVFARCPELEMMVAKKHPKKNLWDVQLRCFGVGAGWVCNSNSAIIGTSLRPEEVKVLFESEINTLRWKEGNSHKTVFLNPGEKYSTKGAWWYYTVTKQNKGKSYRDHPSFQGNPSRHNKANIQASHAFLPG